MFYKYLYLHLTSCKLFKKLRNLSMIETLILKNNLVYLKF